VKSRNEELDRKRKWRTCAVVFDFLWSEGDFDWWWGTWVRHTGWSTK